MPETGTKAGHKGYSKLISLLYDIAHLTGDLIEELQYLNPNLPVRIYQDGNIYNFTIDDDLVDRVDFNVMED